MFFQDMNDIFNNAHALLLVIYGTESIRFLGPKIWNIIQNELKQSL